MSEISDSELIKKATSMLKFSYSPYSSFCVGAALLSKNEKIYTGCNIENAAFGPSNCAERTAFFKAISEGQKEFTKIAIVGGKNSILGDFCPPCGVCRQVMAEFCSKDFKIILANSKNEIKTFTLGELLPQSFDLEKS